MSKLLSRKLAVAISTIAGVFFNSEDPIRAGIAGAVAIAYVIAQAFVDRGTLDKVSEAAADGVGKGRELAQ